MKTQKPCFFRIFVLFFAGLEMPVFLPEVISYFDPWFRMFQDFSQILHLPPKVLHINTILSPTEILLTSNSKKQRPICIIYPAKKNSAQVGVRVNSVLTRNDCIKCYISLFK